MRVRFAEGRWKWACSAALAVAVLIGVAAYAAETDFRAAVVATHPVAYYRLNAISGKSEVGTTQYDPKGGVTVGTPGALAGMAKNQYAKFDGKDGYILTTQVGGVGETASLMAWVNLAALPSDDHHFFYVTGESQYGNDLDLQFETDNVLRFFTAAGGNLSYKPDVKTLVNQWHMIVATLDTATHTRAIYWDGKQVATDKGGGEPGKNTKLSIGASTVFSGRFFDGGIEEVALWNRALKATEVATIYAAAGAMGGASRGSSGADAHGAAMSSGTATSGPFATKAKVTAEDSDGPIHLKREEQIALMFLTGIQTLEYDCQDRAKHACTMEQLVSGTVGANGAHLGRLKFDPKGDPNYAYTVTAGGMAWEAHANAKKPGLAGFYFVSRSFPTTSAYYSTAGTATIVDKELTGRGVEGDSFAAQ